MTGTARDVAIRKAASGDVAVLASLATELGYPTSVEQMDRRCEALMADPSYGMLVAERGGQVVGASVVHLEYAFEADEQIARIMAFVVTSGERGAGVGRTLISAVEGWAREMGAADIMLTTHERRAGAHEFYRSMGYEMTGHRFYKVL